MEGLFCYKKMPVWTNTTIPKEFKEKHNTQQGTWAKLAILRGSLEFAILTEQGDMIEQFSFSADNQPPFIEPQQWHKIISCSNDLECQLGFYCKAEDYSHKKYDLTKTHSEVLEAAKIVKPCKALDLGCGGGRNSLFLHLLGFDVTAVDQNIDRLQEVVTKENLQGIKVAPYNINEATITDNYGFIFSTVVLMFLERVRIPTIIQNMQQHTDQGGYNLIVSAMSTEDFPCPVSFSFTFKENELKEYYQGWEIIKYNENIGELHRKDENGQRIKLRFATLLAKKIN
ncbi:SAM-dependent methyltransferase TehB [Entomomonas asaccharolytica]|uniref:SAM-dependent methyltransferase TehB n=1 Tax=Entomomonas asaccharolytica TaxID=2785331 RepID=A0A974NGV2_9GAMM|nr:SAM-dependent methyltransferase TehB [Entomomonas asaccharolytica]QQP86318.1 SAM-dependent methyltransferase TehB [Entomomonas asaccharolytica]